MYILKADYKGKISIDLLNMLLAEDETTILTMSCRIAEDTIKSTAGVLYNVVDELAKTGTARNYYLLNLAIDIAIYNIYQRSDDEQIPEKIIKNHDDAINDLQKLSIGKMSIDLPPKIVETTTTNETGETVIAGGTGLRRIGSQPKRTHHI